MGLIQISGLMRQLKKRWAEFEEKGPSYSLPLKTYSGSAPSKIGPGILYIALYPKDDFKNLMDFNIFQFYSSSVQQSLIESGELDLEWFVPQTPDEGTNAIRIWGNQVMNYPLTDDIQELIDALELPHDVDWVSSIQFNSWFYREDSDLEIIAQTSNGFLTIFTINE